MTALRAKGTDGQLELDGETLRVLRKGTVARLTNGASTHEVQLSEVQRIDFKAATSLLAGYIRFAVPGEIGEKPNQDRNAVYFQKRHGDDFAAIHAAAAAILAKRGPLSDEQIVTIEEAKRAEATTRIDAIMSRVTPVASYGGHVVNKGQYSYGFSTKRPIAGAVAEFESGSDRSRPTLTRIGAGALLAGPVGAIAGGMFKKDRTKVYVTIVFPDQATAIIDGPAKDEKKLREFAAQVNRIAAAGQPAPAVDPAPVADPAEQLMKLKGLLDAGVLTEAQYEEKSAPLIAQL